MKSVNWVDKNTKKEVMKVDELKDRKKNSEVTEFSLKAKQKLSELYDDDVVIAESDYERGEGFTVKTIKLVEQLYENKEHE